MKKPLLYKLALFLASLMLFAYIGEILFDWLIRYNYNFKPSYIASGKIDADILVSGPSRAVYGVNPQIIEDATQLKCYNIGINAASIKEHFLALCLYTNHHKHLPKVIALEIHRGYFSSDAVLSFHAGNYVAFMHEANIWQVIEKEDPILSKLSYFPFLKHSIYGYSNLNEVFKGALQAWEGPREVNFTKGYQAQQKQWPPTLNAAYKPEVVSIDSSLLEYYHKYIQFAQSKGIMVVLFTAPYYKEPVYNNTPVHLLAQQYNIPYWQYNDKAMNHQKEFFYDSSHLNEQGATAFSALLAKDLSVFLETMPKPK